MSKMGAMNLDVEEYIHNRISKDEDFDEIVRNVQNNFPLSDADAENKVWELMNPESYEHLGYRMSHGVVDATDIMIDSWDLSDDADALASAGFGTDEDYGGSNEDGLF